MSIAETKEQLEAVTDRLRTFRAERGWEDDHTPRNLAVSIAIETGELLEHFQWEEPAPRDLPFVAGELADVLIYALNLADVLGLDPAKIVNDKITDLGGSPATNRDLRYVQPRMGRALQAATESLRRELEAEHAEVIRLREYGAERSPTELKSRNASLQIRAEGAERKLAEVEAERDELKGWNSENRTEAQKGWEGKHEAEGKLKELREQAEPVRELADILETALGGPEFHHDVRVVFVRYLAKALLDQPPQEEER